VKSLAAVRYSKDSLREFGFSASDTHLLTQDRRIRASLLSNAVRIAPRLFPSAARAVEQARERLRPSVALEAYVTPDSNPNAQCIHLNGEVDAALVLTSGLVELLSEEELSFVAGHEIGHLLFGHTHYPAPDDVMEDARRLHVLALHRAAEISADRLGFICAPSADDAFRGMLKVASGLSDRHLRLELTAYLGQLRELESLSGHRDAIYDTHPMFPLRVRALLWFSLSEPYYYWMDESRQAPISGENLDQRIEADFAAVSGFGLDHISSDALRSVKIWSLVRLFTADRRLSKEEQQLLAEVLGADEAQSAIRFVAGHGNRAPAAIQRKLSEALEAAHEQPEKLRLELFEELERVASSAGGTAAQRLQVLDEIACALKLDREVEIRPWSFQT
jgi:hypothetical protein